MRGWVSRVVVDDGGCSDVRRTVDCVDVVARQVDRAGHGGEEGISFGAAEAGVEEFNGVGGWVSRGVVRDGGRSYGGRWGRRGARCGGGGGGRAGGGGMSASIAEASPPKRRCRRRVDSVWIRS